MPGWLLSVTSVIVDDSIFLRQSYQDVTQLWIFTHLFCNHANYTKLKVFVKNDSVDSWCWPHNWNVELEKEDKTPRRNFSAHVSQTLKQIHVIVFFFPIRVKWFKIYNYQKNHVYHAAKDVHHSLEIVVGLLLDIFVENIQDSLYLVLTTNAQWWRQVSPSSRFQACRFWPHNTFVFCMDLITKSDYFRTIS